MYKLCHVNNAVLFEVRIMKAKTYEKILSVLSNIKKLELDDVVNVYDEFNVSDDEEIDFLLLLKDIKQHKTNVRVNLKDAENMKVRTIERKMDKLARQAKKLPSSCTGIEEDEIITPEQQKQRADAEKLLNQLDYIRDQFRDMSGEN